MAPAMKLKRVRGLIRSRRTGSTGACGRISSTWRRIWASRSPSRASSIASSTARFSACFSVRSDLRSALWPGLGSAWASAPACAAFSAASWARASLAARDASSTASRSCCDRSRASRRSVARVDRLSAIGWSSGRQSATASGPSTARAPETERSAPTRSPRVVSSCATSIRSTRSPAAISPPRRSVTNALPERSTSSASPVSLRCAIRRDWRAFT
ncbi:hypothetical protein SCYAM73S_06188 [Streptomyces cyaneofuscatus]